MQVVAPGAGLSGAAAVVAAVVLVAVGLGAEERGVRTGPPHQLKAASRAAAWKTGAAKVFEAFRPSACAAAGRAREESARLRATRESPTTDGFRFEDMRTSQAANRTRSGMGPAARGRKRMNLFSSSVAQNGKRVAPF